MPEIVRLQGRGRLNSQKPRKVWQIGEELTKWREGNPLFVWRKERKVPRNDVSAFLGVSLTTVLYWEHGNFKPSSANMARLREMTEIDQLEELWEAWDQNRPG